MMINLISISNKNLLKIKLGIYYQIIKVIIKNMFK